MPTQVLGSVLGSVASSLVSGMMSGDGPSAPPTPPAPDAPAAMPTPDDKAQQASRERQIATSMRQNMNRASTILTGSQQDKAPLGS